MPIHESPAEGSDTIKVVEERLDVQRRLAEVGALRVRLETSVRTDVVDAPVVARSFQVERVERNAVVQAQREPWYDGEVLVVPVYEEVVVRQLLLKEELRIVPTTRVQPAAQAVELKSQSVVIERRDAEGRWHEVPASSIPPAGDAR
jgi:stress response protein YsnF